MRGRSESLSAIVGMNAGMSSLRALRRVLAGKLAWPDALGLGDASGGDTDAVARSIAAAYVRLTAALAAEFSLALAPARGQSFPDQPIRVIVPTQAGGMADILSRVFAQKVKEHSGATVIVENKTGANGVLAADHVAKSRQTA